MINSKENYNIFFWKCIFFGIEIKRFCNVERIWRLMSWFRNNEKLQCIRIILVEWSSVFHKTDSTSPYILFERNLQLLFCANFSEEEKCAIYHKALLRALISYFPRSFAKLISFPKKKKIRLCANKRKEN